MSATTNESQRLAESPQALVAIARAASLTGDRELCRVAVQQLREQFGMELRFLQESNDRQPATAGGAK